MIQQFYPVMKHPFNFELNKDMHFAAAHFIPHLDAGACAHVHGHTYFVNVTLAGNDLDHMGFLVNFQEIKKAVHDRYDHSVMNEHPEFAADRVSLRELPAPSTEVVAREIFRSIQDVLEARVVQGLPRVHCIQVLVRETPTSYVTFRNPSLLSGVI